MHLKSWDGIGLWKGESRASFFREATLGIAPAQHQRQHTLSLFLYNTTVSCRLDFMVSHSF